MFPYSLLQKFLPHGTLSKDINSGPQKSRRSFNGEFFSMASASSVARRPSHATGDFSDPRLSIIPVPMASKTCTIGNPSMCTPHMNLPRRLMSSTRLHLGPELAALLFGWISNSSTMRNSTGNLTRCCIADASEIRRDLVHLSANQACATSSARPCCLARRIELRRSPNAASLLLRANSISSLCACPRAWRHGGRNLCVN